jgi:hypothetical protein
VLDWDCLFLIPKPWYGPVLAPVLISGYFALACCVTLVREQRGRPLRWGALAIVTQLAAGTIWFWSFIKDAERIGELGYDAAEYSWLLFLTGAIIGLAGLTLAARPVRVAEALEL